MKRACKAISLLSLLALLTGCANPWNPQGYAGIAAYEIKPIISADGVVVCCSVWIRDGKEVQVLNVRVSKTSDGTLTVDFSAGDVRAFEAFRERAAVEKAIVDRVGKTVLTIAAPIIGSLASP